MIAPREVILTALSCCERASVRFLQRLTGLDGKGLSSCLCQLAEGGLIEIEDRFVRLR